MIEAVCMKKGRKGGGFDLPLCSYDQQRQILFIVGKEDFVVRMDDTQFMASPTLLALLCDEWEDLLDNLNLVSNAGEATASREAGLPS